MLTSVSQKKLKEFYEKQKDKTKDTNLTEPDQSQKIAQTVKMKDAISDFIDAKCV